MTSTSIRERRTFVDTSAFFAARDRRDVHHASAIAAFERLEEQMAPLVTTSHVIAEAATFIRGRLGFEQSRDFLLAIKESQIAGPLEIYHPIRDDLAASMEEFLRWAAPRFSFVDALSFVVCRRLGITRVLAYDDDFRAAGFELVAS